MRRGDARLGSGLAMASHHIYPICFLLAWWPTILRRSCKRRATLGSACLESWETTRPVSLNLSEFCGRSLPRGRQYRSLEATVSTDGCSFPIFPIPVTTLLSDIQSDFLCL